MARVVRPGGVVVATVLGTLWQDGGFRAFIYTMVEECPVDVVEPELRPYHRGRASTAGWSCWSSRLAVHGPLVLERA